MVQQFSWGETCFWHRVKHRNMHINEPFTPTHMFYCSFTHWLIHINTLLFPPLHCLTRSIFVFYAVSVHISPPNPNTLFTFFVCCTFVIMLMSFPFFVIIIWWPSRHCAPPLLTPSVNPSCRFRCSSFIFVNIFSWMPAGFYSARSEISRHRIVEIDALDAQLWPRERSARPSIIYIFSCLVATTTWLSLRKVSLRRDETLLF